MGESRRRSGLPRGKLVKSIYFITFLRSLQVKKAKMAARFGKELYLSKKYGKIKKSVSNFSRPIE